MPRHNSWVDKWREDAYAEMNRFLLATDEKEQIDAITACAQILDMLQVRGLNNIVRDVLEYGAKEIEKQNDERKVM